MHGVEDLVIEGERERRSSPRRTAANQESSRRGIEWLEHEGPTAIFGLVERGLSPQLVFVPNRFNIREIVAAYDLAVALGCGAFVTGPLMRIGRAAAAGSSVVAAGISQPTRFSRR